MGRRDSAIGNPNEGGFFNQSLGVKNSMSVLGSEKPILRSSSGLSKPRLVKIRKQSLFQHGRSSSLSECEIDPGSNPFCQIQESLNKDDGKCRMGELGDQCRNSNTSGSSHLPDFKFGKPVSAGFVFGATWSGSVSNSDSDNSGFGENMEKSIPDEMRNLNVGSGLESQSAGGGASSTGGRIHVNTDEVSILPDGLRKLKIDSPKNGVGGQKSKDSISSSYASGTENFVFGGTGNVASAFAGSTDVKLPEEMKKLNIEDSRNVGGTDKASNSSFKYTTTKSYVFGSNQTSAGSFDGTTVDRLSDKITELDVKSKAEDSGRSPEKIFSSSRIFGKDTQASTSVPTPLIFRAAVSGGGSSVDFKPGEASIPSSSFSSSGYPTGSLFGGMNQKVEFNAKAGSARYTGVKKGKGRKKQPNPVQQWATQCTLLKENSSQENPESPGCYSPMEFSPYEESSTAGLSSRETSIPLDEYIPYGGNFASNDEQPSDCTGATYDDMITSTHKLNIDEGNTKCVEQESEDHIRRDFASKYPSEEFVFGADTRSMSSTNTEKCDIYSDANVTKLEAEASLDSNMESHGHSREPSILASSSEDVSDSNFTFAASTSSQEHLSAPKRHFKKKYRTKVGQDLYNNTSDAKIQLASPSVQVFGLASSSLVLGPGQAQKGDSLISKSIGENILEADKALGIKQEPISTASTTVAAQEACEKWRLRGNQAYANGNLSKAEEYYTRGVNCVAASETSESLLRALALCYSNRAAARMSSGRMREALEDCQKAAALDPRFIRVQVRAANCHLALGETEDALRYFERCLQSEGGGRVDPKIVLDASNGLEKSQQVADCIRQCVELLNLKTSEDAEHVVQIVAQALSISPYSEKLLEMKAEALMVMRKYEEVVQLCEQSLTSAETNSASVSSEGQKGSKIVKTSLARLWRWRLISMSYFHQGKLDEALELLEKLHNSGCVAEKCGSMPLESSVSLLGIVRELLRHKAAGNEAFQSGRHSDAVEHYTSALSCNIESRPFAAICFCNRAAAHQALGQITDAIADCSLAIALDGHYAKAISRRAALHEMIKDYGHAADDLQRLISILENQAEDKSNQSRIPAKTSNSGNDLAQARIRLSAMEDEAKKGITLDMYLILGVEPSATASEIRKSYRKAALRHHPDKAGQFMARSDTSDDGLWKDIVEEVHKDTDRLFKMIAEAYAILSDPTKRSRYDLEQMKNTQKKGNGSSTTKTSSDPQNYPFERSGSTRHWQEARRSYGTHYSQWSESSRSSRHL